MFSKLSILFLSFSLVYSQLTSIEQCGIDCAAKGSGTSACSANDLTCICNNQGTVQDCIWSTCAMEDRAGTSQRLGEICAAVPPASSSSSSSSSTTSQSSTSSSSSTSAASASTSSGSTTTTSNSPPTSSSTSHTSASAATSSPGTTAAGLAGAETPLTSSKTVARTSGDASQTTVVVLETVGDSAFPNAASRAALFGPDVGVAASVAMITTWVAGFGLGMGYLLVL